jgi:hypothetical protein
MAAPDRSYDLLKKPFIEFHFNNLKFVEGKNLIFSFKILWTLLKGRPHQSPHPSYALALTYYYKYLLL